MRFTAPLRGASSFWGAFPLVAPGDILLPPLRGVEVAVALLTPIHSTKKLWNGWGTRGSEGRRKDYRYPRVAAENASNLGHPVVECAGTLGS